MTGILTYVTMMVTAINTSPDLVERWNDPKSDKWKKWKFKGLAKFLRWGKKATPEMFAPDGSVSIGVIRDKLFKKWTMEEATVFCLLYCYECDKGRFRVLVDDKGGLRFFATNGHSKSLWTEARLVPDLVFLPRPPEGLRYAFHGTDFGDTEDPGKLKASIRDHGLCTSFKAGHLKGESRIHCHAALEISNTRKGCRLLYRIDLEKLTEMGIPWWVSRGRVQYVLAERFPPGCLDLMTR
jgi:RNA:NAD 2'-phosphotransferase (TPT1/KptA family)